MHFWCPSNHSQLPGDLSKGATVRVHSWTDSGGGPLERLLWAVTSWTWTDQLLKLVTCIVKVLCQMQVKCYIKTKLRGLSPRANYTDWAAAAGRRNLCQLFADRGVSRGQRNGFPRPLISVFWTGTATFYSSSSSIDLTRLSGPRSRPTINQKIC